MIPLFRRLSPLTSQTGDCEERKHKHRLTWSCTVETSMPSKEGTPNKADTTAGLAALPTHKYTSMPFSRRNTPSLVNLFIHVDNVNTVIDRHEPDKQQRHRNIGVNPPPPRRRRRNP